MAFNRTFVRVPLDHASLLVDLRDRGVARSLYLNRSYEPAETCFFRTVLQPGMSVFDVGANIGYFTTLAARAVGRAGIVIAAEPDPHNFRLLEINVKENGFGNVHLINQALDSDPGEARLFLSEENFGDHRLYKSENEPRTSVNVGVDTVDGILSRLKIHRLDVAKLDVQGYEERVLGGMTETIAGSPDLVIVTELWPFGLRRAGGSASRLVHALLGRGFTACVLNDDGSELPVTWDDIERLLPDWDTSSPETAYLNLLFRR